MWGESARTSQGRKDAMTVPTPSPQPDDNSIFVDKSRKFDEADASFRSLVAAMAAYRDAILASAECGVAVARKMDTFFAPHDRQQKVICSKFLQAQIDVRDKWANHLEKAFDNDVVGPINSRVSDIPVVRQYIKQRSVALTDMQRRQKKLQSERKKEGPRLRDKHRRLKEISDRYAMYHDEVIQRFNYIDRNMGTFVTSPLRSLVSIMTDMSQSSFESLQTVHKMLAETPPLSEHLSPIPPMPAMADLQGGTVDPEKWDDMNFDESQPDEMDEDDDDTVEPDENDTDSTRASARRPPPGRGRVKSADAAKGPASSLSAFESLGVDLSGIRSPRRERSASSAPAEANTIYSPTLSLPANSITQMQRDITRAPSSAYTRHSHLDADPYFLPAVGTSAASSTSIENLPLDALRMSSQTNRRRRRRDAQGSGDTVCSEEKLIHNDVLMRVVSIFDYLRQETNELALHVGDVIEVTAKNDSGWWTGQSGTSRGYFPRNYTRELTEKEELDFLAEKRRRKRHGHRRQQSSDSVRKTQSHASVSAS